MNADVSVDNDNHSAPADEICQFPNDMDVNSTGTYKTVYLCADKFIGVNSESPYTLKTLFLARTPDKFAGIAASQNPAGLNATMNDIIPACGYLLSKQASFITCINLPVTAGVPF